MPLAAIAPGEAAEHFGLLGGIVGLDNPTANRRTQDLPGWRPAQPGLIADLDEGHYFRG